MNVHTRAGRSHRKETPRAKTSPHTKSGLNKRDIPSGTFHTSINKQVKRNRIRENKPIDPADRASGKIRRGRGKEKDEDTKHDEKQRDEEKLRKTKDKRKANKEGKERQGVNRWKKQKRKGK